MSDSARLAAEAAVDKYSFVYDGLCTVVSHLHCRELLGERFELLLQDPIRKQGPAPELVYYWNVVDYLANENLVPKGYKPKDEAKENDFDLFLSRLGERIQDDLICLLDSQFGEVEYVDEVKTMACQIVVDRVLEIRELSRVTEAHDNALLQKLSEIESQLKKEKPSEAQ